MYYYSKNKSNLNKAFKINSLNNIYFNLNKTYYSIVLEAFLYIILYLIRF